LSELPDWTPAYQRIVESCANCPSLRVLANDAAQAVAARYGLPQGVTPNSEQKGQEFFLRSTWFRATKDHFAFVRSRAYKRTITCVHLCAREGTPLCSWEKCYKIRCAA